MAKAKSQTAPGKAVYLLHEPLRVRNPDTGERSYYQPGDKRGEDELHGLVLPALEQGGLIEKVQAREVACAVCAEQGTQAQQKARFTSAEELRSHYKKEHPAFQPTEEV